MEAVDSHVHLTNPQKVRYAWMEGLGEQWNKPWTEGDLQAQISACPYNIDSVVFVEVGLVDTKSAIAEAEWVLSTPWNLVKAYVAMIPVHEGKEGVTRFLYAFRGHDGQLPKILKGGRVVMPPFASDVCTNPKYIEGVQTLGTLGHEFLNLLKRWGYAMMRNKQRDEKQNKKNALWSSRRKDASNCRYFMSVSATVLKRKYI
eukprot:GEMP01101021.1.p1 GENE.GEMP01101021.1~~GEMP01101021.1.p1  ORF type:complete len:218 (+),score=34.11 GEMP01101021.1:49-654(+)